MFPSSYFAPNYFPRTYFTRPAVTPSSGPTYAVVDVAPRSPSACSELVLVVPKGADASWTMTAKDDDGAAVAFAPADVLSARVWSGVDSGVLFTPAASWTDAAAGAFTFTVGRTLTTTTTPGLYPLQVNVTLASDGRVLRLLEAWLEVGHAPGATALPPVYCTYQDMVDFGGGAWLESLRRKEGFANFLRERGRARTYVDDLVTNAYRPWDRRGLYAGYLDGGGDAPDARDATIKGWLAANRLMVTEAIKELAALKALELACRQRVTLDDQDLFVRRANYYRGLCRSQALKTTAELDANGDGAADYAFVLGQVNLR